MHRVMFIQCLPALAALAVSFLLLAGIVKFSGGRLNLRRLRELHRCQDGGVQSLAFLLTLPLFIMIVLFIVQVSQLMIGMITVNYAAFAAARSAIVWLPAHVPNNGYNPEEQNQINWQLQPVWSNPGERLMLVPGTASADSQLAASQLSYKFSRIRTAAVLGCAPVSPSRDVRSTSTTMTSASQRALLATQSIYRQLAPGSTQNRRTDARLANKIRYADRNTIVYIEWRDARRGPGSQDTNTLQGRTYNPFDSPAVEFHPNEIGWQDPVTVYVIHRFALFPGPGRMLANLLVRPVGVPNRIGQRIPAQWQTSYIAESDTYSVLIPAAATITAEAMKSARPYAQQAF